MNFYHHGERLVQVGWDDGDVKKSKGRQEFFEIAEDEQLIGCELDRSWVDGKYVKGKHGREYYLGGDYSLKGVRLIKM